jgi:hypothetical protein
VETLRTMQERAVAQKARMAGHKAAKTKAKQSAKSGAPRGVVPGVAPSLVPEEEEDAKPAAIAAAATSVGEDSHESLKEERTALELAIEAGDWQAVGQAAAMIGDKSVGTTSTGTGELNQSTESDNPPRVRDHLSGEDAERASAIDELIDVGDWTGVISTVNNFASEADVKGEDDVGLMSQEEEEALKQAEVWMRIAEQKKAEGATDAGASDAAEWAIQRSLSQLKDAENKKKPPAGGGSPQGSQEEDEV